MEIVVKSILVTALMIFSFPSFAKDRVENPTLLKPSSPFTPSGTVSTTELELFTRIELNKIETGELNGVKYRIYYTDGSGSFAGSANASLSPGMDIGNNWSTACKKDPMNDAKSCYVQRKDLWVWLYANGRLKIFIGGDQYPGTSASIRVDSNPAVKSAADNEGVFTAAQSKQILQQLISGGTVATRYVDWPYKSAVDESVELYGFDEAYQYIQWAIQQIK